MIIKYKENNYVNLNNIRQLEIIKVRMPFDADNPETLYRLVLDIDDKRHTTSVQNLTEDECIYLIDLFESAVIQEYRFFNLTQELSFRGKDK